MSSLYAKHFQINIHQNVDGKSYYLSDAMEKLSQYGGVMTELGIYFPAINFSTNDEKPSIMIFPIKGNPFDKTPFGRIIICSRRGRINKLGKNYKKFSDVSQCEDLIFSNHENYYKITLGKVNYFVFYEPIDDEIPSLTFDELEKPPYREDEDKVRSFEDLIAEYIEPVNPRLGIEKIEQQLKKLEKYCQIFGDHQINVKWPSLSTNIIALTPEGQLLPKIKLSSNKNDVSVCHHNDSYGNYFKITIHENDKINDTEFLIGHVESELLNDMFFMV